MLIVIWGVHPQCKFTKMSWNQRSRLRPVSCTHTQLIVLAKTLSHFILLGDIPHRNQQIDLFHSSHFWQEMVRQTQVFPVILMKLLFRSGQVESRCCSSVCCLTGNKWNRTLMDWFKIELLKYTCFYLQFKCQYLLWKSSIC